MPSASWLVDTNILLRLVQSDSPLHATIRKCTDLLWVQGAELFYTSQILAEFWNVCTRPADRNGFGFSTGEANALSLLIEQKLSFAPDNEATHQEWRRIIVHKSVAGVKVHDARLVAVMRIHSIENLLTLNVNDFKRYDNIVVVAPDGWLAAQSDG